MSSLREGLEQYLAVRRSLGFELRLPGTLLRGFIGFMEAEGAQHITTEAALRWAKKPEEAQPSTWAGRLGIVRRFATWRSATDPRTEIPPEGLLPHRYRRKPPYIYSDEEIGSLVQAARKLPSSKGLRPWTYSTLFGLLAATGMRVSEALNLDQQDVDPTEGILGIWRTKFGKSRLLPVHASTVRVLKAYAKQRDRILPAPATRAFFLAERGTRITDCSARYNFAKVSRLIGLRPPQSGVGHGRGPRLHDMRHRFATRTLISWYRAGRDVERELPKLAAYLGHVHVSDTYWYLEAVPELLQLATERLMRACKEVGS